MYKIIIMSNASSDASKSDLLTSAIVMDDYRAVAIFSGSEIETQFDSEDSIDSHLFPDCYDEDDITIELCDNSSIDTIIEELTIFVKSFFDEDNTNVYGYDLSEDLFDSINEALSRENVYMQMQDYHDQFRDGREIERDIITVMSDYHINTKLINKDSQISMLYFLGALTEKIHNN